jgi:predicted phage-related endonuclease
VEKYWPQLQHNMMVCGVDRIWISVITGAAGFSYLEIEEDPFYQVQMLRAEQDFWDCVETGRIPGCPVVEAPIVIADRVIDMSGSNSWAEQAGILFETKPHLDSHAKASKEIKSLMPPEAKEARGHGIKITRSKTGTLIVKMEKPNGRSGD